MTLAPKINKRIQGIKRYNWRICPYATNDPSNRVPVSERGVHSKTGGKMRLSVRDGHGGAGWVCEDPNCPYYLGNAITPVYVKNNKVSVNRETGEYTITPELIPMPLCTGTWFWEK